MLAERKLARALGATMRCRGSLAPSRCATLTPGAPDPIARHVSFAQRLREQNRRLDPAGRRWLFVPYDQLSDRIGPLSRAPARELGIVLVESPAKAARRPYHRQKLALVLSNLRHFALEQASRGVLVRHVVSQGGYADALRPIASELGQLDCMRPAERELRVELDPLVRSGALEILPHEGWLTTRDQFDRACGRPPYRMDAFYRLVRKETGVLVERGKPAGGRWSFDAENREPYRGSPEAPSPPIFEPDAITLEVRDLLDAHYAKHPGRLDLASSPGDARRRPALRDFAMTSCLPHFGPFEDAMSTQSTGLFHTRLSALLNLHRVLPRDAIDDAIHSELPLASKEGFVRQILGWREFVRHVHEASDGFRTIPGAATSTRGPGASPNALDATMPLPAAYWQGAPSGLNCLDSVVSDVWREGYSHHITRLMILSNLATLLGISPRELTDWFWVAYTDAYDWVVEPNVLGMGTYAAGPVMTTKPYVSGAAYIAKMSDYCRGCRFDPKKNCPVTPMYWAFLERNASRLHDNPRMMVPLAALRKRSDEARARDRAVLETLRERLSAGRESSPDDFSSE
jgi:deoxyribodipyrimidine photolyase-related protein